MDQLGAIRSFIRVVQSGSFSAAAREQNTGQATVSKKIAALEQQLGVKLLTRSSRQLSLTEAGQAYFERCLTIIGDLDELETEIRSETASPKGQLRVTAPIIFGQLFIAPHANEFLERYPDISLNLQLSDQHTDLIAEGIDIAIRAQQLEDSSLIAQLLFDNPMTVVASKDYLDKHGVPQHPKDLKQHNCLIYSLAKQHYRWSFQRQGKTLNVTVNGNFQSNSGESLLAAATNHAGIAQLPRWMMQEQLQSGRLHVLLGHYQAVSIPIHAVYPLNRNVPLKVRCFIEFLKTKLAESPLWNNPV
jgi:DNA-binding transcriptional LysR family regulator